MATFAIGQPLLHRVSWGALLHGLLTLAAAIFGGRAEVPRGRLVDTRGERTATGEPLPHHV